MLLPLLLACKGAPAPPDSPTPHSEPPTELALTAVDPLPADAPAALLLVELDGAVLRVEGTMLPEGLRVDVDGADDARYAFRYRVLDADGGLLYARTTPGPVMVQVFLALYGELSGVDILQLYPQLGRFPVVVPLLDGGHTVELQQREADGSYTTRGTYAIARAAQETVPVPDSVVGSATLHQGGDPRFALDIALLPDGYRAEDQALWEQQARQLADALLATEPLTTYAGRINIHRVDAVSVEAGAGFDCDGECRLRDTAFQTVFPIEFVNRILGTDYRSTAVFQLDQWAVAQAASVTPWDLAVVVVNTPHDGGFAMHYATVPTGDGDWTDTGVHEFGHLLGLLGDEYEQDFCVINPGLGLPENITDTPTAPPWTHWIDEGTPLPTPDTDAFAGVVGAFEGAYNCEQLARPMQRCKMRGSRNADFCPVCAELLVRRLFRFQDALTDLEVAEDGDGWTLTPRSDLSLSVDWAVDGASLGATTDEAPFHLAAEAVAPGATVEVTVRHTTPRVRADGGDLTEVRRFRVD